jgi:PAS domain S-box-containing protein
VKDAENASLTEHLNRIEAYMRGCGLLRFAREPSRLRSELAEFGRELLPEIVDEWMTVVSGALAITEAERQKVWQAMYDAQLRWFRHIEDPADFDTYGYLREHTRDGFISEFPASRFLAAQMKVRQILRRALHRRYADRPEKQGELIALLDQEFQERILHITDFFVESKVEELHEQEISYRQTVDNAPAPIFRIDHDSGTVIAANSVAERVTGFPAAELIGRKTWELHPADEAEAARRHWLGTRDSHHRTSEDLHLRHRDGASIPVFVSSGVIEYGRERFIQQICVDISDRRRLEGQLVQSEKMAAIGQLAAGVAHEIRNPLGAIRNALYDLKEILSGAPAEAQEDLRIAEEELVRAKVIIDNLLEFSRVSHAELEPIDLNDLLRKTLLLMNRYLQNSDVRVEQDFGEIPPCLVNQNAMRQVALNLITNAVQAMPKGGTLSLRTWLVPARNGRTNRLAFDVTDSGVGIPAEHLKNIFNPFFTTKEPGQGTGLGLSVVDSIVRQNRGEIRVESNLGRGTTFHLEFPCNCPEPSADIREPL